MTQHEIIDHLHYLTQTLRALQKRKDKAEAAERNYTPRKEARSWGISEQMERTKEELKEYVNKLL